MKQPIYTGTWGRCHLQGIAVDQKKGFLYYSFTTKLIKATLDGEIVGSLDGLVGHLGCIAYCEEDGCVYGSLEYKNDSIGKGILSKLDSDAAFEDSFYIAKFDVDRIDREDIPAEGSSIMTCVYLSEVVRDYNAEVSDAFGNRISHRYGCSGIDGLTFAPLPGKTAADGMFLYVAYGVYSDVTRCDNDHQVLLCYDRRELSVYAAPLDQKNMHTSGPDAPRHKYFFFTGNTRYGVQNLEYDPHTNALLMAVYTGKKPNFPNFALFAADLAVPAQRAPLVGLDEEGELLSHAPLGNLDADTGVRGWHFPHGSTGLCSLGGGEWLIAESRNTTEGQCGYLFRYRWDGEHPFLTLG